MTHLPEEIRLDDVSDEDRAAMLRKMLELEAQMRQFPEYHTGHPPYADRQLVGLAYYVQILFTLLESDVVVCEDLQAEIIQREGRLSASDFINAYLTIHNFVESRCWNAVHLFGEPSMN